MRNGPPGCGYGYSVGCSLLLLVALLAAGWQWFATLPNKPLIVGSAAAIFFVVNLIIRRAKGL